jgi:hypothetical protein
LGAVAELGPWCHRYARSRANRPATHAAGSAPPSPGTVAYPATTATGRHRRMEAAGPPPRVPAAATTTEAARLVAAPPQVQLTSRSCRPGWRRS